MAEIHLNGGERLAYEALFLLNRSFPFHYPALARAGRNPHLQPAEP
jgi:hypothetical protein